MCKGGGIVPDLTPLQTAWAAVPGDEIDAQKVRALMFGYDAKWGGESWTPVEVESEYELPIVNPATHRTSRTHTHAGKRDVILCRFTNEPLWLCEHKTTTDDFEGPTPYWLRLSIDSQVSEYMLAAWQSGTKLAGTLYDVIRRPLTKPKAIPAGAQKGDPAVGSAREIAELGTFYGWGNNLGVPGDMKETPYLYSLRLARDVFDRPDHYYARRAIPRLDSDLAEYATELWQVAQAIRDARNSGRWFRNSGACNDYNRTCEYLPLCAGEDVPESENWRRAEKTHVELDKAGPNALTNSRLGCFQSCRRKHYYRYEQRLRPVRLEESEALYFGTLMHRALEAWWRAKMPGNPTQGDTP